MTTQNNTDLVVGFLRDPEKLSEATSCFSDEPVDPSSKPSREVETIETPHNFIFLAGNQAFKLAKTLKYPWADLSTPKRRFTVLRDELDYNASHAPNLYIGLRPIYRNLSTSALSLGPPQPAKVRRESKRSVQYVPIAPPSSSSEPEKEIIDWVLNMRRFKQEDLMFHKMEHGKTVSDDILDDMAFQVAEMHKVCPLSLEKFCGFEPVKTTLTELISRIEVVSRPIPGFPQSLFSTLKSLSLGTLERNRDVLEIRKDLFTRECHGDLHLKNLVIFENKCVPFDSVELNDEFKNIDVMYDLAFLLMDLVHLGHKDSANRVLNHYLMHTGDYEGLVLLPLFIAMRATVRAFVALMEIEKLPPADQSVGMVEVRLYLEEALHFLKPHKLRLVAVAGLPGTGKSTISRLIAPLLPGALGGIHIPMDAVRKSLFNTSLYESLPPDAYSEENSRKTYAKAFEHSMEAIKGGFSAVLDGTFTKQLYRDQAESLFTKDSLAHHPEAFRENINSVTFCGIWLKCSVGESKDRISSRKKNMSDATHVVVDAMAQREGLIQEGTGLASWHVVDAGCPLSETLHAVKAALKLKLPSSSK